MLRKRGRPSKQTKKRNIDPIIGGLEISLDPDPKGKRVRDSVEQKATSENETRSIQNDPEKKFGVERLNALEATMFDGTTDPLDPEIWLDLIEKCFKVMRCPEDRKVELATFLLQKEAEKWWKVIEVRRGSSETMTLFEFRQVFEDKYYPSSFRDTKREEFLRLTKGVMTVAEYKQKFTELSQYALLIIAEEKKRFETAIRVERSVVKEDELQPGEGQFRVPGETRTKKFRSSFSRQSGIRSFGGMSQQSLSRKKSRPVAKKSG
ncbi:uncharacterized protein LOC120073654 [Benincasa hispida]|uniref:uncharacterized protein LOC120073654 n=1 Tax=Benincasa hispida TaxID=102211 RepID=UPI001900FD19|nr:uncharacterized protein LOC120073654 [Benincasa hispida]